MTHPTEQYSDKKTCVIVYDNALDGLKIQTKYDKVFIFEVMESFGKKIVAPQRATKLC